LTRTVHSFEKTGGWVGLPSSLVGAVLDTVDELVELRVGEAEAKSLGTGGELLEVVKAGDVVTAVRNDLREVGERLAELALVLLLVAVVRVENLLRRRFFTAKSFASIDLALDHVADVREKPMEEQVSW
jgi:hypothetical protein